MRKLFMFIALIAAASFSYAGPLDLVCGTKRTQEEVNQCVLFAVNGGAARMKKNYDIIAASSKIPDDQKSGIPANHEEWAAYVDNNCDNDVCVYDFISSRNEEVEQFMRKFGVKPY